MPELTNRMKLWEIKGGIVTLREALLRSEPSVEDRRVRLAALQELCRKEALIERSMGIGVRDEQEF